MKRSRAAAPSPPGSAPRAPRRGCCSTRVLIPTFAVLVAAVGVGQYGRALEGLSMSTLRRTYASFSMPVLDIETLTPNSSFAHYRALYLSSYLLPALEGMIGSGDAGGVAADVSAADTTRVLQCTASDG